MGKAKPRPAKGDDGTPQTPQLTSQYLSLPSLASFSRGRSPAEEGTAANLVLSYLRKQNRPYSVTDITNNLHNAITKSSGQKILQQLVDAGGVSCKTQGPLQFIPSW